MVKRQSALAKFIRYASLSSLAMLANSCYILADTFFVSKGMAERGLAALNMALPIFSLINGAGLMLGMGGATKYTILRSAGNKDGARGVYRGICAVYFLLCAVFLSFSVFSSELAGSLGAEGDILPMTSVYVRVILLFSPAFILNHILVCYVRNDGAPSLAMAAMVSGSLSNILLDYIFIFPLGMGMFGAVFATGLAPVISMIILCPHFFKRRVRAVKKKTENKAEPAFAAALPRQSLMKNTVSALSLGVSSFVAEISSGVVIMVFNYVILALKGEVGVAAYGIVANIALVVTSLYTGISQGIQPILSAASGKGDVATSKKVLLYAVVTSAATAVIVLVSVLLFAPSITSIFNSSGSSQLEDIAVSGLRLYFISGLFAGVNIVSVSFFSSLGYAAQSQVISVLRGLVLPVCLSFLLSEFFGMTGVWLVAPVTEFAVMLAGLVMLFTRLKKMS